MRDVPEPVPVEHESNEQTQNAQSIADGAAESDCARLGEVAMRHRDFFDARAEPDGLGNDFLVEDEVVRVQEKGRRFQHAAAEGAKAGVILGKIRVRRPCFRTR